MRYIKIKKNTLYTDINTATLNRNTGNFEPAKPELYEPDLKEWVIHNVFRRHFSFGQHFCVVCGYEELKDK